MKELLDRFVEQSMKVGRLELKIAELENNLRKKEIKQPRIKPTAIINPQWFQSN